MTRKVSIKKRIISVILCTALLLTTVPLTAFAATPLGADDDTTIVTDIGTANSYEGMMGTDADGNRYAGRVWADASIYADGDTVILNSSGDAGSTYTVALNDDEAFQTVFSVLGSSMTTEETKTSSGPMDVVLVLDNSDSMNTTADGTTRMQKVIEAANSLLDNLLSGHDVRLGITAYSQSAETVLPFGTYSNGVVLEVNRYTGSSFGGSTAGVIRPYDSDGNAIGTSQSAGYKMYTNTQAGFDLAMEMLETATGTDGRKPVVILLTDGAANTAVNSSFYDISEGTVRQIYHSNNIDPMIALSTLLSAAYKKASVQDHYGKAPMIYGIGVDLSDSDGSNAIINPKDNFNDQNVNSNIVRAYGYYTTWKNGGNLSVTSGGTRFTFDHAYPQGSTVTDADVAANINYVDQYYNVTSSQIQSTFDQIYEALSSAAFNPITTGTSTDGGTGEQGSPLIFVNPIGQYMEVKRVQEVMLFGARYPVTDNGDGTYSVALATGKNPATNEEWNTGRDILITVSETNGLQELRIEIKQEILPILLEQVEVNTIGNVTSGTITELKQEPLRVLYTVGITPDILLANGEIDLSKIDPNYAYFDKTTGEISFYANSFGGFGHTDNRLGDTHIGFKPSDENRYYYHQSNQGIFTEVTAKDNSNILWDESEYGIVWDESKYELTWMSYDEYLLARDGDRVYTYVTYYHPTASAADAADAVEKVTYLVYTDWKYLKESVAFYDDVSGKYVNYDSATGEYTLDDHGKVMTADQIAAYVAANPAAEIYAVLGEGSKRSSRLHNMEVSKETNATGTAAMRYVPEYILNTSEHNENDVVIWLGNNGKLTTAVHTGIALTKQVTEAIGGADTAFALTVTVPSTVTATPVVEDVNGNALTFSYVDHVLTVSVKAGETVYVTGIPVGTVCTVGEIIGGDYHIDETQSTLSVTVPTMDEALNGTQYAAAVVTNAPNRYGDLVIVKDVESDEELPAASADKVFTFKVQLPQSFADRVFSVDRTSASLATADQVTVGADGSFTVKLKGNEAITVLDVPEGTAYTVTEIDLPSGYANATGVITGTIEANAESVAHFVNEYAVTPVTPNVTVTGEKTVEDVHGSYAANEDFIFVLDEYDPTTRTYTKLDDVPVKQGGTYTFNLGNYLQNVGVGTYYFRIHEAEGNTAGMSYDATNGLFAVVVTDSDADGTPEYTVTCVTQNANENGYVTITSNNSGYTVTKNFTNIYDVEKTHVDVNIHKDLENDTGVVIPYNSFEFVVENASESYRVHTDSTGIATVRIPNLGEGTYVYTVEELAGALNGKGMTYDASVYTLTIVVAKNGTELLPTYTLEKDGAPQATGTNQVSVTFENTYELSPVTHTISGKKVLDGGTLENGKYSFELYETDASFVIPQGASAKETVSNNGSTFAFAEQTYTKVGTYHYSVKEKVGVQGGVTYDTTHYHVTVTVTVDENAPTKLAKSVVVTKVGHNADTSGEIVFVNEYRVSPTTYQIKGTKTLTGRAMHLGEFTFVLSDGNDTTVAATDGNGKFAFPVLTFTAAGEYVYTVTENVPAAVDNNGFNAADGITYDTRSYEIVVTVTDNKDGTLTATAGKRVGGTITAFADIENELVFENIYTPAPATVVFEGEKVLIGTELKDGDFTFNLYETDHTFRIDGLTPAATAANEDGVFAFAAREFDKAGTYYFVVAEDAADPMADIVYDGTKYTFGVSVQDVGDGQLRAVVTSYHGNTVSALQNSVRASVTFTNAHVEEVAEKETYLATDPTVEIDGKKVAAGDILTYVITYTNYTGQDVEIDILDTVPEHTTYVEDSAVPAASVAGNRLNWVLNVARGESVQVSFSVKVNDPEAIVFNTAYVYDGINTYTTNEVVNHTVENPLKKDVFSPADVAVSIDGKPVNAGDELIYRVSYTNVSNDIVDVEIADVIPKNTTYVEGSADNGGVYENGKLTWIVEGVEKWQTVTVSFKVTVDAGAEAVTVKNKATADDSHNTYTSNEVVNYTQDVPVPDDDPVPTPELPQTGENTMLHLWFALLFVTSGTIGITVRKKKKATTEDK